MSDVVWSDPDWLHYFALNIHTALDYFARSSFYDFACNNEIIRQRGLDLSKLATLPPGVEYLIHDAQEPHLFVVRKQMRHSPKSATPLAFYYILDGRIYQAPPLHATVSSRMSRCLFNIQAAFKKIQEDIDPLQNISLQAEEQKGEAEGQQVKVRHQWSQEERERAKQIDGILHNVLTLQAKALPPLPEAAKAAEPMEASVQLESVTQPEPQAIQ